MKSPDVVFRELAKLYDFYRELAKFRLKKKHNPNKSMRVQSPASRR
jgi:hypothetical protein